MPFSRLQIWNMALGELPAQRVETVDEKSNEADNAREAYPNALELLLEDHDYDFATVRVALASVPNDRVAEWRFAYQLPADMARPRLLLPYGSADAPAPAAYSWIGRARGFEASTPFRISGDRLYCNIEGATLEYVTNSPSEQRFGGLFARALALELASRIVMPIKKDAKRQAELIRLAEIARERCKAADMNRDAETTRDFVPEAQLAREGWPIR